MKNVTLLEIRNYFKENLKIIIFAGIFGIIASFIFCIFTPKLYEASFTLSLGRINALKINNSVDNRLDKEIPFVLDAQRSFKNPAWISSDILEKCGYTPSNKARKDLISAINVIRSPDNKELLLTLRIPGRENTKNCAEAVIGESLLTYNARLDQVLREILGDTPSMKASDFALKLSGLNGGLSISDSYVYPSFTKIIFGFSALLIVISLYIKSILMQINLRVKKSK